ncbi:MAG: hypothetical protein RLZZ171_92 [Cyanobacteriota bacterium]|jgi:hypothetical protein
MSFLRQYVAPLMVLLIFLIALFAVSIRIFLPSDMAAPAPISQLDLQLNIAQNALDNFWT